MTKPQTCAESRCGDGWLDESIGEVCDNGGQDNEGCSMDCTEIDEGWQCGHLANGCWRVQERETQPAANDQYLGATQDQNTTTGDAEVVTSIVINGVTENSDLLFYLSILGVWPALKITINTPNRIVEIN